MTDYDQYKLQNPDDDAEEQQRRLQSRPDPDDLADELWDRYRDGDLNRPDIDRVRRK